MSTPAPSTVNSQILQSVEASQQLTIHAAAKQSAAALELAMAHSLGLAMFNATAAQQRGQMQREAATAEICAQLLSLPAPAEKSSAPREPRHPPKSSRTSTAKS